MSLSKDQEEFLAEVQALEQEVLRLDECLHRDDRLQGDEIHAVQMHLEGVGMDSVRSQARPTSW